jgi:branched-chain amino acid transport system ATP-binding protein
MTGALLSVRGLTRRFGGLTAVDALDFDVPEGAIFGLLGPNGSGKTTALDLISGKQRPDGGTVTFDGRAIGGEAPDRIARRGIARTFQLVRVLPSLTCAENVVAALAHGPDGLWGREAASEARALLERVGLASRASAHAAELTYIDQKRLELARALGLRPRLLLLDEWLAGLNPTELGDGIALIRELGASGLSVLMVEHVMDAIRALCSTCVVMNAGRKIAEGPPDAVLAEPAVVEAYLGADDA